MHVQLVTPEYVPVRISAEWSKPTTEQGTRTLLCLAKADLPSQWCCTAFSPADTSLSAVSERKQYQQFAARVPLPGFLLFTGRWKLTETFCSHRARKEELELYPSTPAELQNTNYNTRADCGQQVQIFCGPTNEPTMYWTWRPPRTPCLSRLAPQTVTWGHLGDVSVRWTAAPSSISPLRSCLVGRFGCISLTGLGFADGVLVTYGSTRPTLHFESQYLILSVLTSLSFSRDITTTWPGLGWCLAAGNGQTFMQQRIDKPLQPRAGSVCITLIGGSRLLLDIGFNPGAKGKKAASVAFGFDPEGGEEKKG